MSKTIRLAAAQAASVFLDKQATIVKAIDLIRQAGEQHVDVLAFPEGFVPTMPQWYFFRPATSPAVYGFVRRLAENAVEIPGPEIRALADAARQAHVFVVIGVCERVPDRPGLLYNTQVFIDETGQVVGKHRKLVPTLGELLVHTEADAYDLDAYPSGSGARVSGLLCGENANPLAAFAVNAAGANVHVSAWPAHFNVGSDMRDQAALVSRALAYQMKAFVIVPIAVPDERMIDQLPTNDDERAWLRTQTGGSAIYGPLGQTIAGPMEPGEGLLIADVDAADLIVPKTIQDFGTHRYNRFDLMRLDVEIPS